MSHAFFAPSAAHRWINCPGSMAFEANQKDGGSSDYADDGTASHTWGAMCLTSGQDAEYFIGTSQVINGKTYTMDEERASYVQMYVDDVRRRAMNGHLLVERYVPIPDFGEDQGGTPDARIIVPSEKLYIVEDLKYGTGERVYAENNAQGLSYVLGGLPDAELFGEIERFMFVVHQPRLGHVDEWEFTRKELNEFRERAVRAIGEAGHAMVLAENDPDLMLYLNPGAHTCRWCRAKAACPKLAAYVAEEVRADFETIHADGPVMPAGNAQLAKAANALPLVELWCKGVRAELWSAVSAGQEVIGPDGKPFKIVAGNAGKRVWSDEAAAEAALLGQLSEDKVYAPRKIITAPAADKLLNKKKTKKLWEDVFEPMITRQKSKPQLVPGSDPRPPYSGAADAADFEEISDD